MHVLQKSIVNQDTRKFIESHTRADDALGCSCAFDRCVGAWLALLIGLVECSWGEEICALFDHLFELCGGKIVTESG